MSGKTKYRLSNDVILIPTDDGNARLLDLQGRFYALSEVAARMLEVTLEQGSAAAAADIAQHRRVSIDRVRTDLERFLEDLMDRGLLQRGDHVPHGPGWKERIGRQVLVLLTRLRMLVSFTRQSKAATLLKLASLSCRWLGWAATVRLWERVFPERTPVQELVREQAVRQVDQSVRKALAQSNLAYACKERGLAAWALARRAGLKARLFLGLSLYPLQAHCWSQVDEICLGDEPERCAEFRPIRIY